MTKNKTPTGLVGGQYLVSMIFWIIFTAIIITFLVLFINERERINNENNVSQVLAEIAAGKKTPAEVQEIYKNLMSITYPLIDFSLLSFNFFGTNNSVTDWSVAWNQRATNINMAYSYLFITAMIALIALCYYIVIIIKLAQRRSFEWRYGLSTNFPNDYVIFNPRMYLNFLTNLTIIFSFFNFLTTLISLAYGVLLVLVSYFFWYVLNRKTEVLVPHKWWKATNFSFFVTVLLIQNGYTLIKAIFSTKFGVDLDLILSIIIPIGTITVIIAVFIKNMLSTKVTGVRNAIKTIGAKVSAFRIFYYTEKEKALEDYAFVTQLPTLVKGPLSTNSIDTKKAYQLMTIIDETAVFMEQHFATKEKEKNYMLYHLFNEITDVAEIEEIKANVLKVEAKKQKGDKHSK
ncbi:hypothetical protein S100390_v1c07500 [Spiroplasma sp. NBRC 100390]|uniref:hypothetical protein n=1 Tax=unclassified Spiroplasma TaxID=2637901 RepID=UPI00089292A6|nr:MULTISPECIES: hypothetical protein [unclassified Spiroplasma]AOX44086.1 hypothetical protein STU14_v1c07500 [Spiroplasma sp. TU-14]APE13556.1 hypothetical protein S100390_v1c07500 [Spiroplasma sp. NBRC 100390]